MTRAQIIRWLIVAALTGGALASAANPAGIPPEYALLYAQDFSSREALKDFVFSDPQAWTISSTGDRAALELVKQSAYRPPHRSPFNIALLADKAFGDVIVETDCLQTGKEYGHRDMVIVFGFQSPSRFYYAHIATAADEHAHNCFIVNDAPRKKFGREVTKGVSWGLDVWHHLRLVRKASDGTVRVFFDDMTKPIMTAEDKTFGPGGIGFGSFDDTGKVSNIKVWSTSAEPRKFEAFPK